VLLMMAVLRVEKRRFGTRKIDRRWRKQRGMSLSRDHCWEDRGTVQGREMAESQSVHDTSNRTLMVYQV
jgi:hypothetical protein